MELIIRKATLNDASDLSHIVTNSWSAAYAQIIPTDFIVQKNAVRYEQFVKNLSVPGHNHYIVFADQTPVGTMYLAVDEIVAFYLHPDYFRMGFGTQMMDYVINLFKNQGSSEIFLWVLEENHNARKFYEKCGFSLDVGLKEIEYGKKLTCVRYIVKLL